VSTETISMHRKWPNFEKTCEVNFGKTEGQAMQKIFEATRIKKLSLANRFVYSATWDGLADDKGFCTPKNTERLLELAHGGVGLIITGMAFVRPEGQAAPWQLAIYNDEYIPCSCENQFTGFCRRGAYC
jgi:hypothetical protein